MKIEQSPPQSPESTPHESSLYHGPRDFIPKTDYNPSPVSSGTFTVIVVDDNQADVWLVQEALEENGVHSELFVAADGEEAFTLIDRIENGQLPCPHLVVLDLNLPKVNGFEVLKRLRSSQKCGKKPVVIFSSSNAQSDRKEAARLGAAGYIEKPSNLSDLPDVGRRLKEVLFASQFLH